MYLSSGLMTSGDGRIMSPQEPPEGEEVSLDFESFLHNNGTLYSCFNHHGTRVYVDQSQVETLCPLCPPQLVQFLHEPETSQKENLTPEDQKEPPPAIQ